MKFDLIVPADQSRGLMGWTELPLDQGMIFQFGQNGTHTFWMKNTVIPLTIFFIVPLWGGLYRITSVIDMEPGNTDGYVGTGVAAIEVNQGAIDKRYIGRTCKIQGKTIWI